MEIIDHISAAIQKAKGISRPVAATDRLREDLGLDSFDSLMVVCELEDVFRLNVNTEDIKTLVTVQDIIDSLEASMSKSTTQATGHE